MPEFTLTMMEIWYLSIVEVVKMNKIKLIFLFVIIAGGLVSANSLWYSRTTGIYTMNLSNLGNLQIAGNLTVQEMIQPLGKALILLSDGLNITASEIWLSNLPEISSADYVVAYNTSTKKIFYIDKTTLIDESVVPWMYNTTSGTIHPKNIQRPVVVGNSTLGTKNGDKAIFTVYGDSAFIGDMNVTGTIDPVAVIIRNPTGGFILQMISNSGVTNQIQITRGSNSTWIGPAGSFLDIWSQEDIPFRIGLNNLQRLKMDSLGRIAISVADAGAFDPFYAFHIKDSGTNPRIVLESTSASSTPELNLWGQDGAGNQKQFNIFASGAGDTWYNNHQYLGFWFTDTWNTYKFYENGHIVVTDTGSVLIAPVNDGNMLRIYKNSPDAWIAISENDGGEKRVILGTTNGVGFVGTDGNNNFTIRTQNTERVRITDAGDVAIGADYTGETCGADSTVHEKLFVNGGLRLGGGFGDCGAITPFSIDTAYAANENWIAFRDALAGELSEDYLGYKNNDFYFRDMVGGDDTSQPDVWAQSFNMYSDKRRKFNRTIVDYGLEEVMKIKPIRYTLMYGHYLENGTFVPEGIEKATDIGFAAQDLYEVIPEVIGIGDNTSDWSVDYAKLTVVLTKAIQEQQEEIEDLRKENQELRTEIEALKEIVCQDHPEADICN